MHVGGGVSHSQVLEGSPTPINRLSLNARSMRPFRTGQARTHWTCPGSGPMNAADPCEYVFGLAFQTDCEEDGARNANHWAIARSVDQLEGSAGDVK